MNNQQRIANDLYDLIKVCGLHKKQNNVFAELSKKHAEEARKNIKKLLYGKTIEVNGNTIKIGRDILITINHKKYEK